MRRRRARPAADTACLPVRLMLGSAYRGATLNELRREIQMPSQRLTDPEHYARLRPTDEPNPLRNWLTQPCH